MRPEKPSLRNDSFTIIGGGIAGLTTALALNNIGIRATVFEAAPEFRAVGAGITLASNAMKAFRLLDLDEELMASGNPIRAFEICDEMGKTISSQQSSADKPDITSLVAIHRADLHRILLSRLDLDQLINGKRLVSMHTFSDETELTFDDGTVHRSRYLVAADGIHSQVRNLLLPGAKLRYAGYTCWRGLANTDHKIEKATETWGAAGRFGIVPLSDSKIYWFACKRADAGDEAMKMMHTEVIAKIFSGYHAPIEELILNTRPEDIIWSDIYDLEPISRFALGNVVLIGDAAHATTPNLGQGACQAIEDAVVLAGSLNKVSAVEEAFRLFEKKRLRRTHGIVKQSRQTGRIAQLENRMLIQARNAMLRSVPSFMLEKKLRKLYDGFLPG